MARPTAMVFDIGEVLVRWDPHRVYQRLIPDPDARAQFFAEVMPPEINASFDRGVPMQEGLEARAAQFPDHADLIRAWWTEWPAMFGPVIEGSVACLRALKAKGTPVYGLSNFAAETMVIAQRMVPALTEFDVLVVSAHVKANKPEPAIYAALEEQVPEPPEALFFADDKLDNVAAAQARGWTGHHFTGAEGLQAALIAHDLLSAEEIARASE